MNHSSDISRNATATAGPTPIHSPEKSGTQTCQHTAGSGAALLCNSISVDTQKTKSLCCVAAGITALSSSTSEALIPHEKLREAATHDATLIAQDCPPAQPGVGYKHLQMLIILRTSVRDNSCTLSFRPIEPRNYASDAFEGFTETLKLSDTAGHFESPRVS